MRLSKSGEGDGFFFERYHCVTQVPYLKVSEYDANNAQELPSLMKTQKDEV